MTAWSPPSRSRTSSSERPSRTQGFRWGPGSKPGATTDKPIVHGNGFHGLQYNLYALAPKLRPDLAVIDGYQAMEGNGPTEGTPVEHRVAVASLDWLAADRVAVALMGIDLAKMGYLNYCAAAGMGEARLDRMEILGERDYRPRSQVPPGRQRRPAARMDEAAARVSVSGDGTTRNLSRTAPRVRAGFSAPRPPRFAAAAAGRERGS